MKHNLVNFTRGSQLLGHFGFMFAAGLKGPLLVTALVVLGIAYGKVSAALDEHQAYLLWMHVYASGYAFMEFDPGKLVSLKLVDGGAALVPISVVTEYPPMRQAVAAFRSAMTSALVLSGSILAPLFIAFWWVAERFGERSKQKKHLRGASLATLPELEAEIVRHNRRKRAREYGQELGWRWRLAGPSALRKAEIYTPAHIAGVSWPWRREQSHAMLVGTTGTGKTVALTELVSEIRQRGERAVIFDLTGVFVESFYDPDRDVILNPLDARCPAWSVFNDCTSRAEFHAAAESLVPHDGGGSEQFWVLAARTLFVETCLKLAEVNRGTNAALGDELMNADLSDLHRLLEDTMAGPISTPSAARMAESVRAVFNVNAKAMQMLPDNGAPFSIRAWVNSSSKPGSLLFLSSRYVDMAVLSQLLTLWLDTAINTLMTGRRTRELRLWFLIDELGALHRLPSLEKGLQTARNFGGAIVTGVHTFAKLKEVYGENMAMTISSLARTKLILATADRETATWCSDIIGHREVREMEEGYSYGYNNARDAVSLTPRRQVVPLLLPDEFMGLPSLEGYLKFPDGFPAAPVSLHPRDWPRLAEAFIPRDLAARPAESPRARLGPGGRHDGSFSFAGGTDDEGDGRKTATVDGRRRNREAQRPAPIETKKGPTRERASHEILQRQPQGDGKAGGVRPGRADANGQSGSRHESQQGLPFADRRDEARPDRAREPADGRTDLPDPSRPDAENAARAIHDQRLQDEQQRDLLGGAAREDPGEVEPDL